VGNHLAAAGHPGKSIAAAVSSSGLRAAHGDPALAALANAAFVSGFRLVLLICFCTLVVGSIAAAMLARVRVEVPAPAPVASD
jgi:hypothetical protein